MEPNLTIVLIAAIITALFTGLGALPLYFIKKADGRAMAIGNAIATGLMLAASFALVVEGTDINVMLTIGGLLLGLLAIMASERILGGDNELDIADLQGASAAKALMILGIMTAHSFAEGIGVGVAFAGERGLGDYITAAIALHNVPEGLAIALVLVPMGTPIWKAALWAIFTSLPQPIMAGPAFMFVESFAPFLPVGLGLAAGAMIWMVVSEILPDALQGAMHQRVATVVTLSFAAMVAAQLMLFA